MADAKAITIYKAIDIFLRGDTFFAAIGGHEMTSEALKPLREKIDAYLKNQEVRERKKLAIPAITDSGKEVKITGIHARLGNITSKPPATNRNPDFYPNHPYVKKLLNAYKAARKTTEDLQEELRALEIDVSHRYAHRYGLVRPGEYERLMDELKNNAAAKLKLAQEADRG